MSSHIMHQEVTRFLKAALECSIYVQPTDPGLTYAELVEAAKRAGHLEGEINDAIRYATTLSFGSNNKLIPNKNDVLQLFIFMNLEEPDYRNINAFHFVFEQLRACARSQGAAKASIERSVLVEHGAGEGLSASDVQIAIAVLILNEILVDKNGIINFAPGKENYGSPGDSSNMRNSFLSRAPVPNPSRALACSIVKDIIERRTDGRPLSVEPLDAFAEQLSKLGYGHFRMWWQQMVSELKHTRSEISPVSVTVLAAALVEGALTFVVKHGRSLGLGMFSSPDYDKPERNWKIDDLVKSAAASKADPILDQTIKPRAESLVRTRQRIHAGRMLTDFPQGVSDLRPEEARDARQTAELVVRCVLDWLGRHPPSAPR